MREKAWGVEITKVSNGFTLKDSNGNITVVEEDETDALSAGEKLLWEIIDYFDLRGSKHDRERILVTRQMGSNYVPGKGDKVASEGIVRVVGADTRPTRKR
jgi:hypothetical protein